MPSHCVVEDVLNKRRAGVLLHPTSLPGPLAQGDFGHEAYRFVEFLNSCGFSIWQMLPLGPTHSDLSPYQCLSSHAGNPTLISLSWLDDKGWLDAEEIDIPLSHKSYRKEMLKAAANNFYASNNANWLKKLDEFKADNSYWLDDFALYMAIKESKNNAPWYLWPEPLRNRSKAALNDQKKKLSREINQTLFEQFIFYTQWHEIREYAHSHNVIIFGDMPIFVAHDSADVWANRQLFLNDTNGNLSFVAGVPPDAFSDTGQRWGNPLYAWDVMAENQFQWWKERFRTQLKLFDLIRIDHFRGLESFWQIPAGEDTAMNGQWVKAPGEEFLAEMLNSFDNLPVIAEDLGVITEEVIHLRDLYELPGMKILQFAFDSNSSNPYLPHNHTKNSVVYTGTHDNDTTMGWWSSLDERAKKYFLDYLNLKKTDTDDILSAMRRMALASVCNMAILPMQDILALDTDCRMNTPGTIDGNWQWRFNWEQVKSDIPSVYKYLLSVYDRAH